ncbi:LptF/LptG family permease [Lacunimicrobium album]
MKLIQRVLLGEMIRIFFSILTGVTVILVFIGVFREASEHGLGPEQILAILPFIVPSLLPFTIPATMLLTVCVVYGRMSGDQEITACKSAGINVMALIWPSLAMGAVLSVSSFFLTDQAIPWAMSRIQWIVVHSMEEIFFDRLKSQHQFIERKQGIIISTMDVDNRTLIKPTITYKPGKEGTPLRLQAERIGLEFDIEKSLVHVRVIGGYYEKPGEQKGFIDDQQFTFPLPKMLKPLKAQNLPVNEIRGEIIAMERQRNFNDRFAQLEAASTMMLGEFDRYASTEFNRMYYDNEDNTRKIDRMYTEIHSRYALAGSCLCFVLIGSPFSILQGKKQFLTSFILCFVPIILVYYPIIMLLMNQSKNGTIDPSYGMWIANILMVGLGIYLIRKVLKH